MGAPIWPHHHGVDRRCMHRDLPRAETCVRKWNGFFPPSLSGGGSSYGYQNLSATWGADNRAALHLAPGFFPGFVRRPLPPVLLFSNSNGSGIFVAIAHRRKITDLTTAGTADSHSNYSSNLDFCMLTLPQLYPSCLSKERGGFSAHVIQN